MPADAPTSTTLLRTVRNGDDRAAWDRFDTAYREMLLRFCRSRGVQHADAEDVIQRVFFKLVGGLKAFEYQPGRGRFRDYLFKCVRSAMIDLKVCPSMRAGQVSHAEEAAAGDAELEASWEREWVDHHYRTALVSLRAHAQEQSVAVLEMALGGRSVPEIAADLGMSEAAVYKAQQRMKDRLREIIAQQVRREDGLDD
ncbi:MAG: RNA polymerase sigma factor [Phycisphaerales bacterium]